MSEALAENLNVVTITVPRFGSYATWRGQQRPTELDRQGLEELD